MVGRTSRSLEIGVLGCDPIAQFAHLEARRKARNAELYSIYDVGDVLRERMAAGHQQNLRVAALMPFFKIH